MWSVILGFNSVSAQGPESQEQSSSSSSEGRANTTIEERVQNRRDALTQQLDAIRVQRVAARCENIKSKLEIVFDKADKLNNSHIERYSSLGEKLISLSDRLSNNQINTAVLDTLISEFNQLTEQIETDFQIYHQALEDALEIDCATDADSFLLALEEARQYRTAINSSVKSIGSLVNTSIKNTLNDIKADLESES